MSVARIARKHKQVYEELFSKRSGFLKRLPKAKDDGIKKLEEDKTEIITNKVLGIGEFERDYTFFVHPFFSKKQNENKNDKKLKPFLQTKIANIMERDLARINKNGRYADTGIVEYSPNPRGFLPKNKSTNTSQKKKYRTLVFEEDKNDNKKKRSNILSGAGNNIIISCNIFELSDKGIKFKKN